MERCPNCNANLTEKPVGGVIMIECAACRIVWDYRPRKKKDYHPREKGD